MLESPRLVDEYLQAAVKEAREAPPEPPEDGSRPNFIFPGGPVHGRAPRAAARPPAPRRAPPRGHPRRLRLHGPALALEEGGEDPAARYAARSGAGDANATASADGAAGDDRRPSSPPPRRPRRTRGARRTRSGASSWATTVRGRPRGRGPGGRAAAYPAASTLAVVRPRVDRPLREISSVASGWSRAAAAGTRRGRPSPRRLPTRARSRARASGRTRRGRISARWTSDGSSPGEGGGAGAAEDSPLSDHDALYANTTEWFVAGAAFLTASSSRRSRASPGTAADWSRRADWRSATSSFASPRPRRSPSSPRETSASAAKTSARRSRTRSRENTRTGRSRRSYSTSGRRSTRGSAAGGARTCERSRTPPPEPRRSESCEARTRPRCSRSEWTNRNAPSRTCRRRCASARRSCASASPGSPGPRCTRPTTCGGRSASSARERRG